MKTLFLNSKGRLSKNKFADAIGIDGLTGRITFIGSSNESSSVKSDYDEVIDLKNKLLLPAFNDNHLHLVRGAMVSTELNLRNVATSSEFKNEILKYKARLKLGKWIQGGYFADANFSEKFLIDKNYLDEICADVPVFISRFDNHSCFVNTKALEFINYFEGQPFNSDEIVKDAEGNFTGELKERAMYHLMFSIPQKTLEEKAQDVKNQLDEFHKVGVTSVSDITLPEDLDIYEYLLNKNELNLNINSILPFNEFYNIDKHKKRFENFNNIKFICFKAFYDGSLSSGTAYYHKNYKTFNGKGIRTEHVNSGDFYKTAFDIDKAGYQMAVHAIGDLSVTELLNLNKELTEKHGKRDRRFRIEHAQHIQPDDFELFAKYNILASVQPTHLFSDALTSYNLRNDYETTHNYPELLKYNVKLCMGTDFPIVDFSPFETIYYAVTRKAKGFENGFLPEHKMNVDDCSEAYTLNNAFACYDENNSGSISVGKKADLIVLDKNIFETDANDICSTKVEMTYRNGNRIV